MENSEDNTLKPYSAIFANPYEFISCMITIGKEDARLGLKTVFPDLSGVLGIKTNGLVIEEFYSSLSLDEIKSLIGGLISDVHSLNNKIAIQNNVILNYISMHRLQNLKFGFGNNVYQQHSPLQQQYNQQSFTNTFDQNPQQPNMGLPFNQSAANYEMVQLQQAVQELFHSRNVMESKIDELEKHINYRGVGIPI